MRAPERKDGRAGKAALIDIQAPQAQKSTGEFPAPANAIHQRRRGSTCGVKRVYSVLIGMAVFKRQHHMPLVKTKQNKLRVTGEENSKEEKIRC